MITKNFDFDYTLKTKKIENGKEVETKEKKSAVAEAKQFESIADAIAFFESQEAGKGETLLLAELNDSLKNTAIANMRASLTRIPTVPKSIVEKAQKNLDANEQAQFAALMLKLGLSGLPPIGA
jgi:hypothetical protein